MIQVIPSKVSPSFSLEIGFSIKQIGCSACLDVYHDGINVISLVKEGFKC